MNYGAVLIGLQNKTMQAFRRAGATSASSARALEDLGIPNRRVLRHLSNRGVFRSDEGGRYWLDETGAAKFVQRRNRLVGVSIALAIAAVLALTAATS